MGTTPQFRHEDVSAIPRGFKVRTVTHPTGHQVRIAYSPGSRRTGSGQVVSILHPQAEKNPCGFDAAGALRSQKSGVRSQKNPQKTRTADQVAAMRDKAVKFLRDVVGDEAKAAEIAALPSAEYAARKRITLTNPAHELVRDSKGREWWIQTAKAKDGFTAQGYPVTGHGRIVGKKGSAPFKLVRKPIVAQGASESAASDALIEKIESGRSKISGVRSRKKNAKKKLATAKLVSQRGGWFGFGKPKEFWQYDIEGKTYQARKTEKSKRKDLGVRISIDTATGAVYNPSDVKIDDAKLVAHPAEGKRRKPRSQKKNAKRKVAKRSTNPFIVMTGDDVRKARSASNILMGAGIKSRAVHSAGEASGWKLEWGVQIREKDWDRAREVLQSKGFTTTPTPNPKRRKNLDEIGQAQKLYETFQGKKASGVIDLHEPDAVRNDFAMLGWLISLTFQPRTTEKPVELKFRNDKVRLASNADGSQLYLIGGSQDLTDCLKLFNADESKDFIELGEAEIVVYLARKAQTSFEATEWEHEFGEEGGEPPFGFYNKLQKRIYLVGGDYTIESPGIIN